MSLPALFIRRSFVLSAVFLAAFASCKKYDCSSPLLGSEKSNEYSVRISDINDYLYNVKCIPSTKSQTISIQPVLNGSDTVMFLVNYEKGWELLSADRRAPRVLIKSDDGNTTVSNLKNNAKSDELFNKLSDGLLNLKNDSRITPPDGISDSWIDATSNRDTVILTHLAWVFEHSVMTLVENRVQNHLLETHWGMDPPWNQYSPYTDSTLTTHCFSGCVMVAVGQTLKYLHDVYEMPVGICSDAACSAYVPSNEPGMVLLDGDVSFYDISEDNWDSLALTSSDSTGIENVGAFLLYLGHKHHAVFRRQGAATGWFGMIPSLLSLF